MSWDPLDYDDAFQFEDIELDLSEISAMGTAIHDACTDGNRTDSQLVLTGHQSAMLCVDLSAGMDLSKSIFPPEISEEEGLRTCVMLVSAVMVTGEGIIGTILSPSVRNWQTDYILRGKSPRAAYGRLVVKPQERPWSAAPVLVQRPFTRVSHIFPPGTFNNPGTGPSASPFGAAINIVGHTSIFSPVDVT